MSKILLISPSFFGYELEIINTLKSRGYIVSWLPDRPFRSPILRGMTTFFPKLLNIFSNLVYKNFLDSLQVDEYKIIFVINGQSLNSIILNVIRKKNPNSKFILYIWDSLSNRPTIVKNLPLFDRVLTFDKSDAEYHNIIFRPLFYIDRFSGTEINRNIDQKIFKISFIGTLHTDRYYILSKISKQLDKLGYKYFIYIFAHAKWVYYFKKFFGKEIINSKVTDFFYSSLSHLEVRHILDRTDIVVDIEHVKQTGLTIRTLEALAMGKRLITTNQDIKNYEFYDSNIINILDRDHPIINEEFLSCEPRNVKLNLTNYSIDTWLDEVIQ